MSTVSLRGVRKGYGTMLAADDVSMEIAAGEFLTLLGPSGCGKTTTLRMIAGLAQPDAGQVLIGGQDVTGTPTYRRNIGMVFQSHALFPHMTIAENIGFGLRMRGIGRAERLARAEKALELVHLAGLGGRMPAQLSGGQQQRVALARALVFNPAILLLDEPLGALDRKLREALQIELRELTRRIGMTTVFVTHDQEEAMILSDRIAVMNKGRVDQLGSPAEIFERPQTRFVADFMGFGNILAGTVETPTPQGAVVLVEGLRLAAVAPPGLEAGQAVSVALRAERLRLEADGPAAPGRVPGVVTSALYQGGLVAYRLQPDAPGPATLLVREAASDGGPRFQPGSRATLCWQDGAVRVLKD